MAAEVLVLALRTDKSPFEADKLKTYEVETANGKLPASVGQIPSLRLGEEEIDDVEIAFIDDQSLGDNALLGMSVLGRYRIILDDEAGTLTLIPPD